MKKSICYQVVGFLEEPNTSISGIRNIMTSDPKSYWETPSDLAVVSINFQPMTNFCISIRNLHTGYANPFDLTIYSDTIQIYHKAYKKGSSTTINSQKFIKKEFLAEIDSLKFEFRRQGENIKIYFLLLKEPGPAKLKINGEKELKAKKDTKNNIANLTKELLEKAKKKDKKNYENTIKEIKADEIDVDGYTAEEESEDEKNLQQARLKSYVEELEKKKEKEKEKEKEKDNRNTEEKHNTRSNNVNVPKNSYENLLNEFIIYCDVGNFDLRKIVIDLLQASGACYVENKTDFCTLVISDNDNILGSEVGNNIPCVKPQWLFQSVAKRKVQSFDAYACLL